MTSTTNELVPGNDPGGELLRMDRRSADAVLTAADPVAPPPGPPPARQEPLPAPGPGPQPAGPSDGSGGLAGGRERTRSQGGSLRRQGSGCPVSPIGDFSPGWRFIGAVSGRFCATPGLVRREFSPLGTRRRQIGNYFRSDCLLCVPRFTVSLALNARLEMK